jgi:hypothetical protein
VKPLLPPREYLLRWLTIYTAAALAAAAWWPLGTRASLCGRLPEACYLLVALRRNRAFIRFRSPWALPGLSAGDVQLSRLILTQEALDDPVWHAVGPSAPRFH